MVLTFRQSVFMEIARQLRARGLEVPAVPIPVQHAFDKAYTVFCCSGQHWITVRAPSGLVPAVLRLS